MGGQRRPVRKQQTRTPPAVQPAEVLAPAAVPQAGAVWNPPVPRSVSRLGSEQRAVLDRLTATAVALHEQQADLDEKVTAARANGVSWAAIGSALGTSGEAARQRWGTGSR
jgi:hypothetical protein